MEKNILRSGRKWELLEESEYFWPTKIFKRQMNQLLGEYECKVDPKGRLRLPSGLLEQLASDERDNFVVNRGMEKCLVLYPKKVWDEKSAQVNNINEFDLNARVFQRQFYRGATPLKRDNADRLNFPNQLLEWAGILPGDGEVVLASVNDKVEIWAAAEYEQQLNQERDMAQLAQMVMAGKSTLEVSSGGL